MKRFIMLVAAAALALPALATAQTTNCECRNGLKCYDVYDADGNLIYSDCTPDLSCAASFDVQPPVPADPAAPISSQATAQSVSATVQTGQLGVATLSLDASRPSTPTRLQSNGDQRFPLTVDLRFNATATVEGLPGEVLSSDQELNYSTTEANSYPFEGVTLTLQNDVNFVDAAGVSRFTLKGGQSSITINSNQNGEGGR